MGAQLSHEHDPEQLSRLKQAEETWIEACGGTDLAREVWVDLPANNSNEDKLALTKIRTFQMGSTSSDVPLVMFVHGGDSIALEFADLFQPLAATKCIQENKLRVWFMERPGHGCNAPFDAFHVKHKIHEHLAHNFEGEVPRTGKGDIQRRALRELTRVQSWWREL
jgi:acyl-CoA synthetase (AMP-forming)/AMP-acid ligase II